jgi:hypothetical protein
VSTSPSCDSSLDVSEISAGEKATLTVSWTTDGESRDFEHNVTVNTSDQLREKIQFKVSGTTKSALVVPEAASFAASDPIKKTEASFLVYSQIWSDFRIANMASDLKTFDWHTEPLEPGDPLLDHHHATSGWRVTIWTTSFQYGHYSGNVSLTIEADDGGTYDRSIAVHGRVRPPIIFHSPDIHMTDGLDIGTRFSGKEYQFHVLVRVRGERDRRIEVLDVQPPELKASLTAQSTTGNYRLTISIPAECPMVVFNVPQQHGFVEVGDPDDRHFMNWFPIHGAVVPPEN